MSHGASRLFDLLRILGREEDEVIPILSQVPGTEGVQTTWCRVEKADATVDALDGRNLWFGVQPLTRPATGRGGSADVTEICCLYADIDFVTEHKPTGATREQAGHMVEALSDILGVGPAAVVRSGGGVQPYWPITRTDAMAGAVILAWWREQVIHTMTALSMTVDTGVFDLARILRVPGPANMKTRDGVLVYGPEGGATELVVLPGGRRLAPGELQRIIAANPTSGRTRVTPAGLVVATRGGGGSGDGGRGEDRVFLDRDEALGYLHRAGGALETMATTPEGAGFNCALNAAAFEVAAFVPEFLGVQEAWDLVVDGLERVFPGGPDANDVATMRSGFGQSAWSARAPRPDEVGNPFSDDPSEQAKCTAAWRRNGCKAGRPGGGGGVRRTVVDVAGSEGSGPDGNGEVAGDGFLPEWFWETRAIFGHLRRAAWAAMESPEGVLVAGLALTLANVMPNVKLPACIGSEASLNLMTVLTGDPGDGKSACRKVARQVLQFNAPDLWEFNPGSGPGIPQQFQYSKKRAGLPDELLRSRYRALAVVEESDTIAKLVKNDTNTLSSELRKASMGERLGFGNVGETKTNLGEHEYRFVLMMCLQPQLGGWLLGDDAGGLPQRFLWCSVRDPRIVDGVERPGIFTVTLPLEALPDPISNAPRAERVMGITDDICAEIREARRERKRSGRVAGADLDGHSVLTRLKVAGGLALMSGRLDISDEDWALALVIIHMSAAARDLVQHAVAERAARENRARGLARGRARVVEETVVGEEADAKARARVTRKVLAWLERAGKRGMAKSEIRRKLQIDERCLLDDGILDALLDVGQVRFEDIVKNGEQVGSRWFRSA